MSSTISRFYCSRCAESVFNCIIDGVRVPIVLQFNVGQVPDSGPPIAVNDPGLKLPAWIRELLLPHVPSANGNLCMKCLAEVFGTPCVEAQEDSMFSVEQAELTAARVTEVIRDPEIDQRTTNATIFERVFEAIEVGRGAKDAPPLPPAKPIAIAMPPASAIDLSPEEPSAVI
jgi:hypothetical protein